MCICECVSPNRCRYVTMVKLILRASLSVPEHGIIFWNVINETIFIKIRNNMRKRKGYAAFLYYIYLKCTKAVCLSKTLAFPQKKKHLDVHIYSRDR